MNRQKTEWDPARFSSLENGLTTPCALQSVHYPLHLHLHVLLYLNMYTLYYTLNTVHCTQHVYTAFWKSTSTSSGVDRRYVVFVSSFTEELGMDLLKFATLANNKGFKSLIFRSVKTKKSLFSLIRSLCSGYPPWILKWGELESCC